MSDGYKELDLDNPGKASKEEASDIEIVHEGLEPNEVEIVSEAEAPAKAAAAPEADDDDDDSSTEASSGERTKKLTRSQRLKAQRDAYARQLTETQARLAQVEERARKFEQDANDGAAIGYDLYAKNLDASIQGLRREFDQAFDSGDRERIFEVQQKMATLAAEKQQIERDRRSIPTGPTQQSGSDTRQQTAPTPPSQPARKKPSPAAIEWYERNKTWFNKDPVMTMGARVIDQQMVADGYQPNDPDYFEELDKRLKTEFPVKLGGRTTARSSANPTIQNRAAPAASPGKVRVTITQSDREMANHLGISVEDYAREKARAERAAQTTSQYTEIL
jgi:hypothetical protein